MAHDRTIVSSEYIYTVKDLNEFMQIKDKERANSLIIISGLGLLVILIAFSIYKVANS